MKQLISEYNKITKQKEQFLLFIELLLSDKTGTRLPCAMFCKHYEPMNRNRDLCPFVITGNKKMCAIGIYDTFVEQLKEDYTV